MLSLRAYCLLPQTAATEEKSVRSRNGEKNTSKCLRTKQRKKTNTRRERERERDRERATQPTRRYDGQQPVIARAEARVSLGMQASMTTVVHI